ncbi:MAG: Ig-like domain-containing protein [Actinomycetota bacterium]
MHAGLIKRMGAVLVAAGLFAGVAGGASAHPGMANTKMSFRLAEHDYLAGDTVNGGVRLATRDGHRWAPFAGASLSVQVDGTEMATATTDQDGSATFSFTADAEGDHVVKVVYAGDDSHRKRQRAQGFSVSTASDDTGGDDDTGDDSGGGGTDDGATSG